MKESTRHWLDQNTVHASSASADGIGRYLDRAVDTVKLAGLDAETVYTIIPGIRVSKSSMHATVVLKIQQMPHLVFKIELEIDLNEEEKPYVYGNFVCPAPACDIQTSSFQQLCEHHLENHRSIDGDDVKYCCCQIEFDIFEAYADHVYTKHGNFKAVVPNFDQIAGEKLDYFRGSVDFFPEHPKEVSLLELCRLGADVISNFGAYWIFLWNCQDFANWFLLSLGLPLDTIKPTYTDHVTGSGTESSARSVQRGKRHWGWYKEAAQLQRYNLDQWRADARCEHKGCEMLPPLSIEALQRHIQLAHRSRAGPAISKDSSETVEHKRLEYVFCGSSHDLQLDVTQERFYNMFWLTGSRIDAHSSLVLQPWSIGEDSKPLEYYHTVEIRLQPLNQFPELFTQEIKPAQIKKMAINKTIVDKGLVVKISIQSLWEEMYICKSANYSFLGQNCSHFAEWMMDHLYRKHRVSPVPAPVGRILGALQLVLLLFTSVFWIRNVSIKQSILFIASIITNIVPGIHPLWLFVVVVANELLPWHIMAFIPIASVIKTTHFTITRFYSVIRTDGLMTNIFHNSIVLVRITFSITLIYDIIVNGSNSILPAMILICAQNNIEKQYMIIADLDYHAFVFEQIRHDDRLPKLINLFYYLVIRDNISDTLYIATFLFPLPYSLILFWSFLFFLSFLLVQEDSELRESDSVNEKSQMHISSIGEEHCKFHEPSMRTECRGPEHSDLGYDPALSLNYPRNLAIICYFSPALMALGIVSLEVMYVSIGLEPIFPHVAHRMNDAGLSMYDVYFWHIFLIYLAFLRMAFGDVQFFSRIKQFALLSNKNDAMMMYMQNVFPIAIFLLISFTLLLLVVYFLYNACLATYVLIIGFYPVYLIYAFVVCLLMTTNNAVSNE